MITRITTYIYIFQIPYTLEFNLPGEKEKFIQGASNLELPHLDFIHSFIFNGIIFAYDIIRNCHDNISIFTWKLTR